MKIKIYIIIYIFSQMFLYIFSLKYSFIVQFLVPEFLCVIALANPELTL